MPFNVGCSLENVPFETVFSTKLPTWALKWNKKYRFLFPQRLLMLKICKNMAWTEREWESTKRRLTFWRIFLEILPYKSFTKFGVCSKEDEKKKTIFLAIFCYFSWNKKQIHAQKTFFLESTSCKTTAPHNFNADQLNGSGTYLYRAEWLRQKRVNLQPNSVI